MFTKLMKQNQIFYDGIVKYNLHGVHFQHIKICSTRFLLHYNRIDSGQKNDLLKRGKIIHDNIYNRINEPLLMGLKPDKIDWKNNYITEYKASKSYIDAAIYQLMFYVFVMNFVSKKDTWKGKIYSIENKKTYQEIILTEDWMNKLYYEYIKMIDLINLNHFTKPSKIPACSGCSFAKICWLTI